VHLVPAFFRGGTGRMIVNGHSIMGAKAMQEAMKQRAMMAIRNAFHWIDDDHAADIVDAIVDAVKESIANDKQRNENY